MINDSGNVEVMDQTGGGIVKVTKDASPAGSARGKLSTEYQLPIWSPDGQSLAFVETVLQKPVASTIVEIQPDSVTIERGEQSKSFEVGGGGSASARTTQGGQPSASRGLRENRAPDKTTVEKQPDRVVIERGLGKGDLQSSALYVAKLDGKAPLLEVFQSKKDSVSYMDWSPDGTQLAFLQDNDSTGTKLNIVGSEGGSPREIASGAGAAWNWNPDGRTLMTRVDTGSARGFSSLSIVDADTARSVPIAQRVAVPFGAPNFSPDGGYMVTAQANQDGPSDLLLADRDGRVVRKLAAFTGRIAFAWSPTGAKVAYVVRENPTQRGGALKILDVNTGVEKVISQFPVSAFFWAPDGTRLATFSAMRPADVSPDFPGMVLLSQRATNFVQLATVDIATGAARKLFVFEPTAALGTVLNEFDRYSRGMNIWSPDGKRLVFSLAWDGGSGVEEYVIETEATGSIYPRILTMGSIAVWSPK